MKFSNKINFQNVDSDLLAAGILYFEDYIATLHKNLIEADFANFDAFSIIEIITTTLLEDKNSASIEASIKESVKPSTQLDNILLAVSEFHKILHDTDGKATTRILKQQKEYSLNAIALIIMFLNHFLYHYL